MPVSYTHLPMLFCEVPEHKFLVADAHALIVAAIIQRDTAVAVSYTHLDVYKRQTSSCTVTHCSTRCQATGILQSTAFDLLIFDINLPDGSGLELLRTLRQNGSFTPAILLTANDLELDEVTGLEAGADDYITKPFSLAVLRARVNAQLRRSAPVKPDRIELNGFIFDFAQLEFSKDGTIIDLSKTEQRLLRLLVENRGRTLPRELLLEKVWDGGEFVDENALSVAVRRLRIKLGDAPIKTVYGVGYTWEAGK